MLLRKSPTKRRRISSRPLWMQQNIMRIIRKKRRLWNTYRKSRDYEEYLAYKKVQDETQKLVRQAKRKFERKLAKEAKQKPKLFYSYLKSKSSNKQTVGPLKDGETVISDNTGMANVLNSFFASVFTVEDPNIPEVEVRSPEFLSSVEFPPSKVEEKLFHLKSASACGPDKIRSRVLKENSDVLCVPLAIIFTKSLKEGYVPEDWLMANVTSIFKSGSKLSPWNYRPVSLTCIACKVMESIIRVEIVAHLMKHNLIHFSQHGFMQSKSCQTNLIEYLDTLTKLVDEGHCVDIVYLDFAKAFDKVPHQRLLRKLHAHGISGEMYTWIEKWLSNRKQRVVLNGHHSGWVDVTSGVPQGSVLGPTCFIVFINDIDEVLDLVEGFVFKFADDTKYGRVIRTEEDRIQMQNDINRLLEWAELWQMEFNAKKCKIMHVGRNNPNHDYTMGGYAPAGTVLSVTSEEKDIGVIVHNSLKPSSHCGRAAKKANQVLGQMSRSFHYRDKTWIQLYKTFVRHHLEVSVQAWSPWLKKDIEVLEKVQERAVRMVKGLRSTDYHERLKELGLPSLSERRTRGDCIQVWKYLHGRSPYSSGLMEFAGDQGHRLTRHTHQKMNLMKPKSRLDVRKYSFTSRCVDPWNKLPQSVKAAQDTDAFKRNYDRYLSQQF